jgi:pyruvate/2-oxoglutarate dehydrogenase complex dihydrolipoamide dehydrogenase (E3) component
MDRVQQVIDEGRTFYDNELARDDMITLIRGTARFVSERELECGGERFVFDKALIATGAYPSIPPIAGLDEVPHVTSDGLLLARDLPDHLVAIGGGAIGLEFAQAYRRLGSEVTVIARGERLVRGEDRELAELLQDYLAAEGIRLRLGAKIEAVELVDGQPTVRLMSGERITGDRLLVGTGRTPAIDGLGLEHAGIEAAPDGVVVDRTLRTTNPDVYAIGDATGGMMFTHTATYEAPIAIGNMVERDQREPDYRTIPRAMFTDPELASVGLTEDAAVEAGFDVEVRRRDVGRGGKARAVGDRRGRVKFVLDRSTGEVLGSHILARHGADLLPIASVAMNAPGGTLAPMLASVFPHPTISEAVKVAARG